jgi:NAD(P)-dependent dehydrogenase (short-subunit alcohol dehydrogenase family)
MTVALVTGAGRGVGRVFVQRLAAEGYAVAAAARTLPDLVETARLAGGDALPLSLDVTDAAGVEAAVVRVEAELGALTLVVNNAGVDSAHGPLWETDPNLWWRDVAVSLQGTYLVCRAAVPRMLERGAGRIVNVSSYAALRPSPYNSAYGAAKAALLSLTESLADSLRGSGVHVFAMTPGYVRTSMSERLLEGQADHGWFPHLVGREQLDPRLAADLLVFLASGKADRLEGRFLHALDDVEEIVKRADEVERGDLYAARLRRLPEY